MNITVKKVIDLDEDELSKIDQFVNKEIDGVVFLTSDWLVRIFPELTDMTNASFVVFDNARIVCVYPLFISKIKKLFQTVAYQSPNFNCYPIIEKTLKGSQLLKLRDTILDELNGYKNMVIRANQSPVQNLLFPDYTINDFFSSSNLLAHQVVRIPHDVDDIMKNAEVRFRTDVRKAMKVGYEFKVLTKIDEKGQYIDDILECYGVAYKSKYLKDSILLAAFKKLFSTVILSEHTNIYLLYKDERLIGYAFIFEYKEMAYFSNSFTIRDDEYPSANSMLLFNIMNKLSEKGIRFFELAASYHDTEDADKMNIFKFKRSLGSKIVYGKKCSYFTNKWIRNGLRRFM